jgi:hypothetical protein
MKVIFIALLVLLFYIAFKVLRFFSQISKAIDNRRQDSAPNQKMKPNQNSPHRNSINKKDIVDADFVDIKEEKTKSE